MLQQSYSEKMGFKVAGVDGDVRAPWMGCYGIGDYSIDAGCG